nr:hypothetical protein [Tanacetum cinerariifolium]
MALKLHGAVGSPAALRALAALYEKDVDFEFPFGQVPAFEHGDLTLFESRRLLMWMEVENQKFDPATSKLSWELIFKPMFGQKTDETVVAEFEKKLENVLDVYEQRLTESKYLGGDSFTLADLHHIPNTYNLMSTKVRKLFESRPHVRAWVADILSRPAWVKVTSMLQK